MTLLFAIIYYLFLAASVAQLSYWLGPVRNLSFVAAGKKKPEGDPPGVSVILCVRNALNNLKLNLPFILAQDYPLFEVIVVDDGSRDGSQEYVRELQADNERLSVVSVPQPSMPGKKEALTLGIESARHPLVLLTDADCRPVSRNWITCMQKPLRGNVEIGLGLGLYSRRPGFLNRFIRYEALFTGVQYLALARAGLPYMGVGRNLAYARELFRRRGGLSQYRHLVSGDDDLFVNQAATYFNTEIVIPPDSLTVSDPKTTWRSFYRQKTRHLSVGREYKPLHKMVLGGISLSYLGHYVLGLALLLAGQHVLIVVLFYALRMLAMCWHYGRLWPKWRSKDLLPWVPVLDPAYLMYMIWMAPTVFWGRAEEW